MTSSEASLLPRIYTREEHKIARRLIDEDALKIMYRLIRSGFEAYLVGGAVRDLLLGKAPKDYDVATSATPRQVKSLFSNSRIIGRRFKLVHIFFRDGKVIEISTFRDSSTVEDEGDEKESSPGRMPNYGDNTYGNAETDALRRDITINGLFYSLKDYSIIDYVGGMEDLRAKTIRIIGNPDKRFKEDPVRLIRAIRHSVKAGFEIETTTAASVRRNVHLIEESAAARVYAEFLQDVSSGHLLGVLRTLEDVGLLMFLLPDLSESGLLVSGENYFTECIKRIDQAKIKGAPYSVSTSLAVLSLFGKDALSNCDSTLTEDTLALQFESQSQIMEIIAERFVHLVVPRKERERVEQLLSLWYSIKTSPERGFKSLARRDSETLTELASLCEALNSTGEQDAVLELSKKSSSSPRPGRGRRQSAEYHNPFGHRPR